MIDDAIRLGAFSRFAELTRVHGRVLSWTQITGTMSIAGNDIFLASRARGIHKPRQMLRGLLSIKTTVPRAGRVARYDDLADASRRGWFEYRFQGSDPYNHDNTCLREAWEDRTPFVYLYGLAPNRYEPLWPAYVTNWNASTRSVRVQVEDGVAVLDDASPLAPMAREPIAREYATRVAKVRLHQDAFREQVLDAYAERCAVCRFPRSELLEAAHIVPDREEQGVPEVPNGICLCRLHHAAFDKLLLGISPDGVIELSQRLRDTKDGPTLEHGFLRHDGGHIHLPSRKADSPRREYLQSRYEMFLRTG